MRFCVTFCVLMLALLADADNAGLAIPESASCGILIKVLGKNDTLVKYQDNKSFSSASVMKLVTTATALERLGSGFRYMTRLEYSGEIDDGILHGDVIIRGAGDPTLGSVYFYEHQEEFLDVWVRELHVLGISRVEGAIVADASVFDKQVIPNKWIWEDIANYYGAGCYGLSCFDNKYDLYFGEAGVGEVPAIDSVRPECNGLEFENHVTGAESNRDNAYIYGSPWSWRRSIYGTIPAGRRTFKIKGALPNPPLILATMLEKRLNENGVDVEDGVRVEWEKSEGESKGVALWFSPSVADIIKVTNKKSNNLFAEHLLKTTVVGDKSATLNEAIDSLLAFWSRNDVKTEGVSLYDGSGLSRANLLTPDFIVGVLEYMANSPLFADYFASFAIAGTDGTLRYFLDNTKLQGKVYGKSGSMSGVRCYAGIIEKSLTEKYVFCIMVNNFAVPQSDIIKAIEDYLCKLLE